MPQNMDAPCQSLAGGILPW